METYKLQRTYYGGGKETISFTNIPEEIKFCKLYEISDNQQIWMTIFPYDEEIVHNLDTLSTADYKVGELAILLFADVKPIDKLPEISLEELKHKYDKVLSQYYIEKVSRDGELISIYKILELKGDRLRCACVDFLSNIHKVEVNLIEVDDYEIPDILRNEPGTAITSSQCWYNPTKDSKVANKFNSRVNQILGMFTTESISPIQPQLSEIDILRDRLNGNRNSEYHEEVVIDGKRCVAIVTNGHRYLVAIDSVIKGVPWYSNQKDDLTQFVPYTKGDWGNVYESLVDTPVCNYSDYYELDKLTQNIISAATDNKVKSKIAATEVRKLKLGGLRWNLPNFEVMNYMFKRYDEFFNPEGKYKLGNNVFWLPYSYSVTGSWYFLVYSSSLARVNYNTRAISNEFFRALPVSLF